MAIKSSTKHGKIESIGMVFWNSCTSANRQLQLRGAKMIPTILVYEQFIGTLENLDTDCKMVAKKCIGYWLLV